MASELYRLAAIKRTSLFLRDSFNSDVVEYFDSDTRDGNSDGINNNTSAMPIAEENGKHRWPRHILLRIDATPALEYTARKERYM